MLKLGDIRHTSITVRSAENEGGAIKKAAPHIDKWQASLEDQLPEGATFAETYYVRADQGGNWSVFRYVMVVAKD